MPDRIPRIEQGLNDAVDALNALSEQVNLDESTLRRVKVVAGVAVFGLILDITLTVLVGWGLFGVNQNQDRINELQYSVKQEADRSRAGQCAVITLFLQFEPKTLANPAYTDEQKTLQAQAYTTLKQIAHDLECGT